jgi:hypothetical protein
MQMRRSILGSSLALALLVSGARAAAAAKPFKAGWSLGLGAGLVLAGADDLNKPFAGLPGAIQFPSSTALGADLDLDYGLQNAFIIGVRAGFGPIRNHDIYQSGSRISADITNLFAGLTPGYRIATGESTWLEARLGLGMLMSTLVYNDLVFPNITPTALRTLTGSGFAVWPELAYVGRVRSVGLSVSVGYLYSNVAAMTDDKGQPATYTPIGATDPQAFGLNTGGVSFRAGFNYYL